MVEVGAESFSPIANGKDNPSADDQDVQEETNCKDRFDPEGARPLWHAPHHPHLIPEGCHRDDEEQRRQLFEPEQTPGAEKRKRSKSCQDLREHSSTWRQQGSHDREHARALRLSFHGKQFTAAAGALT